MTFTPLLEGFNRDRILGICPGLTEFRRARGLDAAQARRPVAWMQRSGIRVSHLALRYAGAGGFEGYSPQFFFQKMGTVPGSGMGTVPGSGIVLDLEGSVL